MLRCPSCNCSWMTTIQIQRFEEGSSLAPGRKFYREGAGYQLLKCAKCGKLISLPVELVGSKTRVDELNAALDEIGVDDETKEQ